MANDKQVSNQGETRRDSNQITSDIKEARGFADKIIGRISKTKLKGLGSPSKSLLGENFTKKILRFGGMVLIVFIVLLIVERVVNFVRRTGMEDGVFVAPSPTVGPFRPYNPSVYAEDERVLLMEEDLQVLDRELSTTILKETTLNPPVLDFDINFRQ